MTDNNIPSEEDFQRARAADKQRQRGLSEIRERVLAIFSKVGIHEVFIAYSPNTHSFVVSIFYQWDRQVMQAENSGLRDQIEAVVLQELEREGRGERGKLDVTFEFSSHETVERKCEGNYYDYLR